MWAIIEKFRIRLESIPDEQTKIVTNRHLKRIFDPPRNLSFGNNSLPQTPKFCYSCCISEILCARTLAREEFMRHEYERDETSAATKLTYLLVGGGIGAILALLFAPK